MGFACQNEKPVPKPKPRFHLQKFLLCLWLKMKGVVYYKLLEYGRTITTDIYCQQFCQINKAAHEKFPALVNRKGVMILQGTHCTAFTGENKITMLGGSSTFIIAARFSTDRFSLVSLTRAVHE